MQAACEDAPLSMSIDQELLALQQLVDSDTLGEGIEPGASEGLQASGTQGSKKAACQVCHASLQALPSYYQKYKICDVHRKMDQVLRSDGTLQRFCQQCGRFHPITAFDDNKRSCRDRLARHNLRRRIKGFASKSQLTATDDVCQTSDGVPNTSTISSPFSGSASPQLPGKHAPDAPHLPARYSQPLLVAWEEQRQQQAQVTQVHSLDRNNRNMLTLGSHDYAAAVRCVSADYGALSPVYSRFASPKDGTIHISIGSSNSYACSAPPDHAAQMVPPDLAKRPRSDTGFQALLSGSDTFYAMYSESAGAAKQPRPEAAAWHSARSWPLAQMRTGQADPAQLGWGAGLERLHQQECYQPYGSEASVAARYVAAPQLPSAYGVAPPSSGSRLAQGQILPSSEDIATQHMQQQQQYMQQRQQDEIVGLGGNQSLDVILENLICGPLEMCEDWAGLT